MLLWSPAARDQVIDLRQLFPHADLRADQLAPMAKAMARGTARLPGKRRERRGPAGSLAQEKLALGSTPFGASTSGSEIKPLHSDAPHQATNSRSRPSYRHAPGPPNRRAAVSPDRKRHDRRSKLSTVRAIAELGLEYVQPGIRLPVNRVFHSQTSVRALFLLGARFPWGFSEILGELSAALANFSAASSCIATVIQGVGRQLAKDCRE